MNTYVFTLDDLTTKTIIAPSFIEAQNLLKNEMNSDACVISAELLVYTLTSRHGTVLSGTQFSDDLKKLQTKMKGEYKAAINKLEGRYDKTLSSCDGMCALLSAYGDWFEWVIEEHRIDLSEDMKEKPQWYRYSINEGVRGGIIAANSEQSAMATLEKKYRKDFEKEITEGLLIIWKWEEDDYYDKAFPAVLDCYGS